MFISIIIPLFNCEKYILTCLKSIISQNLLPEEYEVIIINDGSTDSSEEKVLTFIKDFKNIYLFSQPNQGVGKARNEGLRRSKGNFIYFMDADDYLLKDGLRILKENYIDKFPNFDIYKFHSHTVDVYYKENFESIKPHKILFKGNNSDFNKNFDIGWSIWSCIFLKEFLVKNCIFFNSYSIGEDMHFLLSIMKHSEGKILYTNLNIYRYILRKNSLLNQVNKTFITKALYDYFDSVDKLNEYYKSDNFLKKFIKYKIFKVKCEFFFRLCSTELSIKEIKRFIDLSHRKNFYPIRELNNYVSFIINHIHKYPLLIYIFSILFKHIFLVFIKPLLPRN